MDISNLVSITDIPKSFVFPFVISQGFFLFNVLTNYITSSHDKDPDGDWEDDVKPKSKWRRFFKYIVSLDFLFSVVCFITVMFYFEYKMSTTYWSICSISIGYFLVIKFNRSSYVCKQIPYFSIRYYLGHLVCFFPVICFSTGKILAIDIYNNKGIQYVKVIQTNHHDSIVDKTKTKFIGFIGDKIITGSLDNKKLYILDQSSFDKLELTK